MSARGECGEGIGAYRRHLKAGEPPCEKCREFYQKHQAAARDRARARKRRGNTEVVAALGVAAEGVQRIHGGHHPLHYIGPPTCPDPRCREPMLLVREGVYECPNEHRPRSIRRREDRLGNRLAPDYLGLNGAPESTLPALRISRSAGYDWAGSAAREARGELRIRRGAFA